MPYFVVALERTQAWEWGRPMRLQDRWDEHAAFMDALDREGFIVMGGPLGAEDEARRVLLVVEASDRDLIEERLAGDPWAEIGLLRTASIEPWTVLLGNAERS